MSAGQFGESNDPQDAALSVWLSKEEWVEGETIERKLMVNPQKDFDVTKIRLGLSRVEKVPMGEGNSYTFTAQKVQLAPAMKLVGGQAREYPFALTLPRSGYPSLISPHASANWFISGILARRLRKDTHVDAQLAVYTAAAQTQPGTNQPAA